MSEQSLPTAPEDGQGTADAAGSGAGQRGADVPAAEQTGRLRPVYLDPGGSEATRELRDTARRRRDAEEKLQQHLMEAKDHVPNEFHEYHKAAHEGEHRPGQGPSEQGRPEQGPSEQGRAGRDAPEQAEHDGGGQVGEEQP